MTIKFSIHPLSNSDVPGDPLYAVMPDDDSTGFVIGTLDDCAMLSGSLDALLQKKIHGAEIDELDERLGWAWINVTQAVELANEHDYNLSAVYVRSAMRDGKISGSKRDGRDWRAPRARFLGWLLHRRSPGRPKQS